MNRIMKPELDYSKFVILQLIDDLITDAERNMNGVNTKDSYFAQLCFEKFALEQLFEEIARHDECSAFDTVKQFYLKMDKIVNHETDPDIKYLFSVSREMAIFIISSVEGWPWDP